MKHMMKKLLALVMALMLSLSAFALAEEALDAPQEPQAEPEDGEADAGEDAIAIEAVDAVYAEQSADLVEEEPDLPVDEAAELPVEEDVYSEDAANKQQGLVTIYITSGDFQVPVEWEYNSNDNVWIAQDVVGSATWDLESRTLTLDGCNEGISSIAIKYYGSGHDEAQESPYEAMYSDDSPDFTIVLKGTNNISTETNAIVSQDCHLTIKGDGELNIKAKTHNMPGIGAPKGITVAGGTIDVDAISSCVYTKPSFLSVTGGKLTLKTTNAEGRVVYGTATADLSKIDVFYGPDEAHTKQLSADGDWTEVTGSQYARFEAKEEEKKPDNPTTPAAPTAPTATPSVDLMFCRLTCKDAKGDPIKNGFTVKWSAMDGVDGYDVFMARCGKKYALVGTVEKGNPTSLTVENLKVGKCYKAYVAPYVMKGNEKDYLGKSKKAHAFTNNGNDKKTNPAGIRVKEKRTVRVGKKKALNAKILSMDTNRDLVNHVRMIRYFSSNPNVATVSRKGKVKGVGVGKCVIYVLANNGICKQVHITVKPAK